MTKTLDLIHKLHGLYHNINMNTKQDSFLDNKHEGRSIEDLLDQLWLCIVQAYILQFGHALCSTSPYEDTVGGGAPWKGTTQWFPVIMTSKGIPNASQQGRESHTINTFKWPLNKSLSCLEYYLFYIMHLREAKARYAYYCLPGGGAKKTRTLAKKRWI